MLKLVQASIVLGFVAWNIQDAWTPNPLVPGILGAMVAYLVTLVWMKVGDWRSALRRRELDRIKADLMACAGIGRNDHAGDDPLSLSGPRVEARQLGRPRDPVR